MKNDKVIVVVNNSDIFGGKGSTAYFCSECANDSGYSLKENKELLALHLEIMAKLHNVPIENVTIIR